MEIIVPKIDAGLLGLNKPATKEEVYFQSTAVKSKQFLSGVENLEQEKKPLRIGYMPDGARKSAYLVKRTELEILTLE